MKIITAFPKLYQLTIMAEVISHNEHLWLSTSQKVLNVLALKRNNTIMQFFSSPASLLLPYQNLGNAIQYDLKLQRLQWENSTTTSSNCGFSLVIFTVVFLTTNLGINCIALLYSFDIYQFSLKHPDRIRYVLIALPSLHFSKSFRIKSLIKNEPLSFYLL